MEAICLFCHKEKVPMKDWNKRCQKCKEVQKKKDEEEQRVLVGRRLPAAVIEPDSGGKVFVDKFGKEVDNPGYDLTNDPRGWAYTGTKPRTKEMII